MMSGPYGIGKREHDSKKKIKKLRRRKQWKENRIWDWASGCWTIETLPEEGKGPK